MMEVAKMEKSQWKSPPISMSIRLSVAEHVLTREQIKAVLFYAAGLAKHVEVFPIGA
jgi:hypothetical protein